MDIYRKYHVGIRPPLLPTFSLSFLPVLPLHFITIPSYLNGHWRFYTSTLTVVCKHFTIKLPHDLPLDYILKFLLKWVKRVVDKIKCRLFLRILKLASLTLILNELNELIGLFLLIILILIISFPLCFTPPSPSPSLSHSIPHPFISEKSRPPMCVYSQPFLQ